MLDERETLNLRILMFKRAIKDAINRAPTTRDPMAICNALMELCDEFEREHKRLVGHNADKQELALDGEPSILCGCGEIMDFTEICKCVDCGKILCRECSYVTSWTDRSRCEADFKLRQAKPEASNG